MGNATKVASTRVGEGRAAQGVHPTASIQAAVTLFDVALPVLIRELGPELGSEKPDGTAVAWVSSLLHGAIMQRVAMAAGPYVAFLIRKLRTSHLGERQRISRELHDRAAHAVGLGLRHLELHRMYAPTDPDRAAAKLDATEEALREALDSIRGLSAQLRQAVADGTLVSALRGYVRGAVPVPVEVEVTAEGDPGLVPAEVAEEVYLIAREAVRNALLHSGMTHLWLDVTTERGRLTVRVRDDGRGFDVPATPDSGGLASMFERAELLSGTVMVTSQPGAGTVVCVQVPFVDGDP